MTWNPKTAFQPDQWGWPEPLGDRHLRVTGESLQAQGWAGEMRQRAAALSPATHQSPGELISHPTPGAPDVDGWHQYLCKAACGPILQPEVPTPAGIIGGAVGTSRSLCGGVGEGALGPHAVPSWGPCRPDRQQWGATCMRWDTAERPQPPEGMLRAATPVWLWMPHSVA